MSEGYTRQELMAVTAAREFRDGDVAFIGTGLPMVAAYLAKATHAPHAVLIFESGIIDANTEELATGVGDYRLLRGAAKTAGLFYALSLLQTGAVDLGFLGAAEMDEYGNINTTVIGPYRRPKVRLPGSGGANDIASLARRVAVIVPHERRKFVSQVGYLTSPGYLHGPSDRAAAGLVGGGPQHVITDLAVLGFDPETKRMRLESLHPGVSVEEVRANTGFPLEAQRDLPATPAPGARELQLLRTRIDPEGVYIAHPQTPGAPGLDGGDSACR
jgi:acyl CoA:acetate/3-ketoacid CoA transferase beta subunit